MTRLARDAGLACGVLLLALAFTGRASAASFDCAKAATPTEKAICADPELSHQDERVTAAYQAALGLWPAGDWQAFLRREQRAWLKVRDTECKADRACLKRDYDLRLDFFIRPSLKWMGRYVSGRCQADGIYLDVTPRYPVDGVSVDVYACPDPSGNMFLQASGVVDAGGRLAFEDAGCPRTLTFAQDVAILSAPKTDRCSLPVELGAFRRDPTKSPYERE